MQLFVYGSLLRGMSLSAHMQGARFLGPAFVYADMFFLGFYPGIIPGNQVVYGELYEVGNDILPGIDKVEDYYENDPENSIYLRRPIEAYRFSDGQKVNAFAYYYNKESEGKPRIASGDYRRFMHKHDAIKSWLIGYGSNLNSDALYSKIGDVPENKVVYIEGFQSLFNVRTGINGFARANLSYSGKKQKLEVVAWLLSPEQFEKLDIEENVPNLFHRVSMPFIGSDGEYVAAQTYLGNISRLGNNLHPEPHYINIQSKGMREHGIY